MKLVLKRSGLGFELSIRQIHEYAKLCGYDDIIIDAVFRTEEQDDWDNIIIDYDNNEYHVNKLFIGVENYNKFKGTVMRIDAVYFIKGDKCIYFDYTEMSRTDENLITVLEKYPDTNMCHVVVIPDDVKFTIERNFNGFEYVCENHRIWH